MQTARALLSISSILRGFATRSTSAMTHSATLSIHCQNTFLVAPVKFMAEPDHHRGRRRVFLVAPMQYPIWLSVFVNEEDNYLRSYASAGFKSNVDSNPVRGTRLGGHIASRSAELRWGRIRGVGIRARSDQQLQTVRGHPRERRDHGRRGTQQIDRSLTAVNCQVR